MRRRGEERKEGVVHRKISFKVYSKVGIHKAIHRDCVNLKGKYHVDSMVTVLLIVIVIKELP